MVLVVEFVIVSTLTKIEGVAVTLKELDTPEPIVGAASLAKAMPGRIDTNIKVISINLFIIRLYYTYVLL